ncbi:hypothetical protein L1F30_01110 [Simiduia sp. 21SJ11W-1]|uniref:hypothetical protein n=1 Tax=Simiduia sp. 21SJ11W-1 TaxID=2909669 RepID=UPI0020A0C739|nr:hypothetical protein [Simiduia sp. 21SJ11W-1]UTA48155.1 hypothetical protein L1F30_01110 [Simiduia sp. 21SJ11W-1]
MNKALSIIFSLFSVSVYAEDCVFDVEEQKKYVSEYLAKNQESHLSDDGFYITIPRGEEIITFGRGGCVHFGIQVNSEISRDKPFTEQEFFEKVVAYVTEFGSELVKKETIVNSIESRSYSTEVSNNRTYYYFSAPEVVGFEASLHYENARSFVYVSFYIN